MQLSFHRRKFFSTLERLEIRQYSTRPRTSAATSHRPSTSNSYGPSFRRVRKRNSLSLGQFDSKVETHFYLSLPDKVRRQQFSKEEQARIQQYISNGSTLLPPRSPHAIRRPSTASTLVTSQRSHGNSFSATRKDCKIPLVELSRPSADPMLCFDSTPTRMGSRKSARRPSLHMDRSKKRPSSASLSPMSASSALGTPTSPVFSHHRQISSRTTSTVVVRPSIDSSISGDPAATYYQDPEARKKLRQYLASPQKFDEAVAFGFPSLPPRVSTSEREARTPHSTSGNDAQTFLKQDLISFIDGYSSDHSESNNSTCYTDSPITPADGEDILPRRRTCASSSIFADLDKSDLPSLKFKFDGMPNIAETSQLEDSWDPLANREMTLRMTLTRPELRATDEELYSWTREASDPLALESLQMSDDTTGKYGAFAVNTAPSQKRRSGFFKKFLGRAKNEWRH